MEKSFAELGIAPTFLNILASQKFVTPTPIQEKAIPVAITGKDVVGIAQTGTGKTLAFGIPMIQRLAQGGQGLVVLPTRELALQVEEVLRKIGNPLGVKIAVLIGGTGMGPQISAIKARPHIIVATPGRLIDHIETAHLKLNLVKILVLDEADRMLDMGFAPQLKKIFAAIPNERQTMLFSATMPAEIMRMASGHMKLPVSIEVAPQGTTAEKVSQEIFIVDKGSKTRLLEKILLQYNTSTLVFTRTKFGAKRLARSIRDMGHSSAEIHGNRSLGQRKDALEGFKTGKYRVLVATDIAARGIDVKGIGLVLNFDLPTDSGDYVHRIGRTARAGTEGHAISFAEPNQRGDLRDIERLIRRTLPISKLPEDLPPPRQQPAMSMDRAPERSHFGRRRPPARGHRRSY